MLTALRQQLAAVATPRVTSLPRPGGGIATGIAALDAALTDGGLPRGRLTEIVGARGSGKTTLVRAIVARALADKRWVAYIDATRTLAAADWAALAETERLWIVRPPPSPSAGACSVPGERLPPGERSPPRHPRPPVAHGPWCADVLLRSGSFGLVVLDGGGVLTHAVAVRLTRLARESDAALVVLREEDGRREREGRGPVMGGAVRLRVRRQPQHEGAAKERGGGMEVRVGEDRWRSLRVRLAQATEEGSAGERRGEGTLPSRRGRAEEAAAPSLRTPLVLQVTVEKGGTHHVVEVGCAIEVARRMCSHSQVPDRRGVATRNRRGERVTPDAPGVRRPAPPPHGGDERAGTGGKLAIDRAGCSQPGTPPPTANRPGSGAATLSNKRRCAEPALSRDHFLLTHPRGPGDGPGPLLPAVSRPLAPPPPSSRT